MLKINKPLSQEGVLPSHCLVSGLHLNWLIPCEMYPGSHVYETTMPQLYGGPGDGFRTALLELDGGFAHWHTSTSIEK